MINEVKIEKLVFGGNGLGYIKGRPLDDVQDKPFGKTHGRPVFVPKSVPGDEFVIEIVKDKKDFAEGIIKKIVKPSPQRIKPPCSYFEQCGGCEHQNISYPDQLKFKEQIFKDILSKSKLSCHSDPLIGGEESQLESEILRRPALQDDIKVLPITAGSDQPFFYRNSIRFFFLELPDSAISFARRHFRSDRGLVPIKSCLLQSETCNQILNDLAAYINENIEDKKSLWQLKIREGKQTNEFMVEIITTFEELPQKEGIVDVLKKIDSIKSVYHTVTPGKSLKNMRRHLIYGSPIIHEKIGKYIFQISPESFFQTNSLGVKTLYDKIKEFADIQMGDRILDLYCGTGTIGIYLSALAKNVVGVESVPEAIRDAADNAKINKVSNINFFYQDSTEYISSTETVFNKIILDPPRRGLDKKLISTISKMKFDNLVYVSCNPGTFARDIKLFENNGLKLIKVQPVDMFPQTHHLEVVGQLQRKV